LALAVPLSRFTSRVGGGSAFYVRRHSQHTMKEILTLIVTVIMIIAFLAVLLKAGYSVPATLLIRE
jgi:hypothetical protein